MSTVTPLKFVATSPELTAKVSSGSLLGRTPHGHIIKKSFQRRDGKWVVEVERNPGNGIASRIKAILENINQVPRVVSNDGIEEYSYLGLKGWRDIIIGIIVRASGAEDMNMPVKD